MLEVCNLSLFYRSSKLRDFKVLECLMTLGLLMLVWMHSTLQHSYEPMDMKSGMLCFKVTGLGVKLTRG